VRRDLCGGRGGGGLLICTWWCENVTRLSRGLVTALTKRKTQVNSRKKAKILPRNRFFSELWQAPFLEKFRRAVSPGDPTECSWVSEDDDRWAYSRIIQLSFVIILFVRRRIRKAISQSMFKLLRKKAAPLVAFLYKLKRVGWVVAYDGRKSPVGNS